MEDPDTDDRREELKRVLDRIQQLPIVPRSVVDQQFLNSFVVPAPGAPQGRVAVTSAQIPAVHANAPGRTNPAVKPWLVLLTTATSAIAVAMVAAVMTRDIMHRGSSLPTEPAGPRHTHAGEPAVITLRKVGAPPVAETSTVAVPLFQTKPPEQHAAAVPASGERNERPPGSPPPTLEVLPVTTAKVEHSLPRISPPEGPKTQAGLREQENGKQRASTAAGDRNRKRVVRADAEQNGHTGAAEPALRPRAAGIGDVLAGGL